MKVSASECSEISVDQAYLMESVRFNNKTDLVIVNNQSRFCILSPTDSGQQNRKNTENDHNAENNTNNSDYHFALLEHFTHSVCIITLIISESNVRKTLYRQQVYMPIHFYIILHQIRRDCKYFYPLSREINFEGQFSQFSSVASVGASAVQRCTQDTRTPFLKKRTFCPYLIQLIKKK